MKLAAVVPSLNPNEYFPGVIRALAEAGFSRIYAIDDGSAPEYGPLFEEAARLPQCVVLRHEVNRGKGRALKTAFEYHLQDPGDTVGLVTLDGDGQHHVEDVVRVARELEAHPGALVLGVRDFSQSDVPKKSELGNKITRTVFRLACGLPITDTQTGLRGVPNAFARRLLGVAGERYEFETNMLLETRPAALPLREVPIKTIYIDENQASHFRPFQDSARIYGLIFRYIFKFTLSSLAGSLVDLLLFYLLRLALWALPAATRLLIATVGARLCSALFNFFVNKQLVFESKARTSAAMWRYGLLCAVQMLASYGGTYLLSEVLPLPAMPAKIITDLTLFFISYFIQRKWVFRAE